MGSALATSLDKSLGQGGCAGHFAAKLLAERSRRGRFLGLFRAHRVFRFVKISPSIKLFVLYNLHWSRIETCGFLLHQCGCTACALFNAWPCNFVTLEVRAAAVELVFNMVPWQQWAKQLRWSCAADGEYRMPSAFGPWHGLLPFVQNSDPGNKHI